MKNVLITYWLIVIVGSYSQSTYASERYWGELGVGMGSNTYNFQAQMKYAEGSRGWSICYTSQTQGFIFDPIIDRETMLNADPILKIFSVLRTWNRSIDWWHLDAGIGLGFVKGRQGENCERGIPAGFGTKDRCDVVKVSEIGVPIQVSAALVKNWVWVLR